MKKSVQCSTPPCIKIRTKRDRQLDEWHSH